MAMFEILSKTAQFTDREDKIQYLRANHSKTFQEVLAYGYDPRITWLLPEEAPPYTPITDDPESSTGLLYTEARKFYLFVRGGHPSLSQTRRETIFIQLLESIHPDDAKMVLDLKNKQLPKGITQDLIEEAYGVYNG